MLYSYIQFRLIVSIINKRARCMHVPPDHQNKSQNEIEKKPVEIKGFCRKQKLTSPTYSFVARHEDWKKKWAIWNNYQEFCFRPRECPGRMRFGYCSSCYFLTYLQGYMPLHRALINVWAYESIKGDPISFRFLLTGWTFTDSVARIAMNQCAVKLVSFFKLQAFLFKIIELSIYLFWRIDFVLLLFGNFPLCNWRIARNRRTIIWFTMYIIKS